MNRTPRNQSIVREAARAFLAVVVLGTAFGIASINAASAQQLPYNTVRNPLIQYAPNAPAGTTPDAGDPPPIGSGSVPFPVTPGMSGSDYAPPTMVTVPQVMGGDITDINSALSGSLVTPPSTPGTDPGNINGASGGAGLAAPVGTGNVSSGGGLNFSAPTTRWAAQRSFDYGRNVNVVNQNASGLADFGELLPNKPNLKMQPSYSQDGPRQLYQAAIGQPIRAENFPNAQATTDLYGQRTNFNPNYQSQMTIAPY